MEELEDLDRIGYDFPHDRTVIQQMRERIEIIKTNWPKRPDPIKDADRTYYFYLDLICKLKAKARRELTAKRPSIFSWGYYRTPAEVRNANSYRERVKRELEENQRRSQEARRAKLERRRDKQKEVIAEDEDQQEATKLSENMKVKVSFAKGNKGKMAAYLFTYCGTDQLKGAEEKRMAAMLDVFSYSEGIDGLIKNLVESGSAPHGLSRKYMENLGVWAIRYNDKLRIRFRWKNGQWENVEVGDFH